MSDDASSSDSRQTAPGPRPLGRGASRALVIGSILLALALAAGGTWLVLELAREGPPPQEAVPQETTPADTSDTAAVPVPAE